MKTKIEIKSVFGKLLFEYEKEDNTVKDTLLKAIERETDLYYANLRDADLKGIDLRDADLRDADLYSANLCDAILCGINLYGANLFSATLCNADLRDASLRSADLHNADLRDADLRDANLRDADLYNADLSGANLGSVNLRSADIRDADLRNTILCYADLSSTNLRGANLRNADLRDSVLSGTDLRNADLNNAKNIPFIPTYLPEGEFIGWKKLSKGLSNGIIVKLKILSDSKRSRACGDKCRCDKALVLEFQNIDGTPSNEKEYTSNVYAKCTYKVGEIVYADSWDDDRWNECSHGIHFFIDRQSAVNY